MSALRRAIRDLNLGAAKPHLFGVNRLYVARIFGHGTQAQNTRDTMQSISTSQ